MTPTADTRPIRFFHRGEIVEVNDAHPTRSVLDWLREDARCTGTKEGCNEGDCGACTVVIGELPETADSAATPVRGLALRTVNACIQFLPTLHGKALFTVEDLQQDRLHPAQQAMVDCHGSQCGFCTPGFVMSLWSACERHQQAGTVPSRQALADELSGNLCRCTGYRPILDAGQRMFGMAPMPMDFAPAVAALRTIAAEPPLHYAARGARFDAPRTGDELAARLEANPAARLLAGSTDIGLWVNKQFKDLGDIVFLGDVADLKRIASDAAGTLRIGAGASLEAAWRALAARHPELAEMGLRFAAPPVRNAGTMGGNVANGSPIGDSAPVLMALDASLELRRGSAVRRIALPDFYLAYMKNALEPGEFVQAIVVPPPPAKGVLRAYKVSKRFDCDISALSAGLAIELDDGRVTAARLAFGGMAAVVKRAAKAEAALVGRAWDEASLGDAQTALAEDFAPLSDMRASADYRRQVAANLLRRFWLETRIDRPLPASDTRAFVARPMVEGA